MSAAAFDTSVRAERERSERGAIINTSIVGEKTPHAGLIYRIFRAINRRFRRMFSSVRRTIFRAWHSLPLKLRNMLAYASAFLGIFIAWMLFYVALIIAFSYSILMGFGVIFVFGMLIYWAADTFGV